MYMDQLRQENEEFRKELFRARDDRDEWKRRAEATEERVAKLEQAIEQVDQDWKTRCRCAMDQRDAAVFRLREMQAAREKGGAK